MLKRYTEFVNEKYMTHTNIDAAVKFIKERAPYFHKDYQVTNSSDFRFLIRGLQMEGNVEQVPYIITSPSGHTREALRPSDNIYNILVDNLWENKPNRSNSIFGRTEHLKTKHNTYGYKFIVVPAQGSEVVICPTEDFRTSFEYPVSKLSDVFDCFERIHHGGGKDKAIDRNDWTQVSNLLESISMDMIKTHQVECEESVRNSQDMFGYDELDANILSEMLWDWDPNNENAFDFFRKELDFEENGFDLYDVEHLDEGIYTEKEFWTNGDCLLINPKNLDEIISRL